MATKYPARCKDTSSTTDQTDYTLNGVSSAGWRNLTRAVADGSLASGDTVFYIAIDTAVTPPAPPDTYKLFEIGSGTWNNTTKVLTRSTIYQSSAGGTTKVTWASGTRDIFILDAADAAPWLVATNNLSDLTNQTNARANIGLGDFGTTVPLPVAKGGTGESASPLPVAKGGTGSTTAQLLAAATTAMVFYQAAAPTGWTKSTTHNDKALRVVSGSGGGSGGSRALSASTVGSHQLTEAEIPAHTHSLRTISGGGGSISTSGANIFHSTPDVGGAQGVTQYGGGDNTHDHPLALAYIDVIICTKN